MLGPGRSVYMCDSSGLELLSRSDNGTIQVKVVGCIMTQQCVGSLCAIQPDCVIAQSETALEFWLL